MDLPDALRAASRELAGAMASTDQSWIRLDPQPLQRVLEALPPAQYETLLASLADAVQARENRYKAAVAILAILSRLMEAGVKLVPVLVA